MKSRKYLAQNPLLIAYLKLFDAFIKLKKRKEPPEIQPELIKRVILCNIAHLGDVIISTAAIDVVKYLYPNASIGFLTSSHARKVIQNHPDIDSSHIFDHYKLNRAPISLFHKIVYHGISLMKVIKEIRSYRYDLAIDLYFYYPNCAFILHQAKIPYRIGFTSGGGGQLYNDPIHWIDRKQHVIDYYKELFERISIRKDNEIHLSPRLPYYPVDVFQKFALSQFVIFHPGSGSSHKEWGIKQWRSAYQRVIAMGYRVIFTGSGKREFNMIHQIAHEGDNFCNRLNWEEWVECTRHAACVITVDTAMQHIAAAVQTPCVALFTGVNAIELFSGYSSRSLNLIHPTQCYPCHLKKGCRSMACIQNISVDQVINGMLKLLNGGQVGPISPRSKREAHTATDVIDNIP
ncbi:MAG: glycosyltransferase family 9 protein [Simkaniaceae bacterium]|nr:glycosyltransferase family 9 protein [Simkaniaceae bacterium]